MASLDSSETGRTAAKPDGGNRVWPATVLYRALMQVLEARRVELNLSMAVVDDMAGLQDGFFAKMIKPDTVTGRQSRWETVELAVVALFGDDFNISISSGEGENRVQKSSLCWPKHPSANALKNRHWRQSRKFAELGKIGAKARKEKFAAMTEEERHRVAKAIAKKARKTRRKNKLLRAQANGARPCVVSIASAGPSCTMGE